MMLLPFGFRRVFSAGIPPTYDDVTLTGTPVTGSVTGSYATITGITVPADADICVVLISLEGTGYLTNADAMLTGLSWDGSGLDFATAVEVDGSTYPISGVGAYYMVATDGNWPGSGAGKTLTFDFLNNYVSQQKVWVGFYKDVDTTAPIVSTAFSNTKDDDNPATDTTLSLSGMGASDMAIVAAYYLDSTNPDGTINGQTEVYNSASGGSTNSLCVSQKLGESSPQQDGVGYMMTCAFGLKASVGGGGGGILTGPSSVTFRGNSSMAVVINPTIKVTNTLPIAALYAADDILFAHVSAGTLATGNRIVESVPNWNLAYSYWGSSYSYALFWKRVTGSPDPDGVSTFGPTTVAATSQPIAVQVSAFRGCVTSGTPFQDLSSVYVTPAANNITGPTITPTIDGGRVVWFSGQEDNLTMTFTGTDITDHAKTSSSTGTDISQMIASHDVQTTSGHPVAGPNYLNSGTDLWHSVGLVLIPA